MVFSEQIFRKIVRLGHAFLFHFFLVLILSFAGWRLRTLILKPQKSVSKMKLNHFFTHRKKVKFDRNMTLQRYTLMCLQNDRRTQVLQARRVTKKNPS